MPHMRSAFSSFASDQVFAAIVIAALLSIGLVAVVVFAERLILPWFFTEARESQWSEPGIY